MQCIVNRRTANADRIPRACGAQSRDDEGVAPPTNEKSNPIGLLRSLERVDKKDATIQNSKFHKTIHCFFDVFYFFFRES